MFSVKLVDMFLALISNVVVPSVGLGGAAHQPGELVPGELPVTHQHVQQLAQVKLSPAHLEPFVKLRLLQGTAGIHVYQVKCLPKL